MTSSCWYISNNLYHPKTKFWLCPWFSLSINSPPRPSVSTFVAPIPFPSVWSSFTDDPCTAAESRDVSRRRGRAAAARSGPAAGSSAGDGVPSAAPVSVRRRHARASPGSRAATAGDEARGPRRRAAPRSASTSAATASTSAPSGRRLAPPSLDDCTSPESSPPDCARTSPGSRGPTCANPATADPLQYYYTVVTRTRIHVLLWPPRVADAHIIFSSCFFLLSSFFFLFFLA